jgi:hypothetical protein
MLSESISRDDENPFSIAKQVDAAPPPSIGWFYTSCQTTLLVILISFVAIFYERGHPGDASLITMVSWSLTPLACLNEEEVCSSALMHGQSHHHELNHDHHHNDNVNHSTHKGNQSTDCILTSNRQYYLYTTSSSASNQESLCNLIGESTLYEREGENLFSVMGIPFLLLGAQVIAASFSLMYVRKDHYAETSATGMTATQEPTDVAKTLKKMTLFLLLVFSICFLFIQTTWKLPGNNLFLVELFLLFAFILIASLKAKNFSENASRQIISLRLVEICLTTSILSVAVLAAAGNTSTNDLSTTFFSILFSNAFLVSLDLEKLSYHNDQPLSTIHQNSVYSRAGVRDAIHQMYTFTQAHGIILLNAWLLMIPFLMHCILTLSDMSEGTKFKAWTVTPVLSLVIFQVLYTLSITLFNWISYSKSGKIFGDKIIFSCFKAPITVRMLHRKLEIFLDFLCLANHICITICIVAGAFVSFPSTKKSAH